MKKKNKDGTFEKIFLKDNIGKAQSQIIYAQNGKIIMSNKKSYLKLYNGKIINNKDNKINTFSFKETEINLSKYKTKTTTFPKMQERSTLELFKCIGFVNVSVNVCGGNSTEVYKQEFFKRFYAPLYIPLLALISSLLILRSKENYNFIKFRNITFLFGVGFIILSEITTRYFGNKMMYNLIYLSIPLLSFILIYSTVLIFQKKTLHK